MIEKSIFVTFLKQLKDLKKIASTMRPIFSRWVVGLDLFGDEMGYPYCPFVTWPFIEFVKQRREENEDFGLRIHCGENVPFADADAGAYRHFIAHMYIVFRCLRFLQRKLTRSIRIGHGIAFARILGGAMNKPTNRKRKSSVLLAEIEAHAKYVLSKIAFEINITSNEYLLWQAMREANFQQTLQLNALKKYNVPTILSTDDDGIWPIDQCPSKHPGHHSLAAEYCRAISSKLITTAEELNTMLTNTRRFRFYSVEGQLELPKTFNDRNIAVVDSKVTSDNQSTIPFVTNETSDNGNRLPIDDRSASIIIFHPDLIKTVLKKCANVQATTNSFFKHYKFLCGENISKFTIEDESWKKKCDGLAPVAFITHCTTEDLRSLDDIYPEYTLVFGDTPTAAAIHTVWCNFRKRFMFPNNVKKGHYLTAFPNKTFLSESSEDEQHDLNFFLEEYLENANINNQNTECVHVFTRRISQSAANERISNSLKRHHSHNMNITVYSNHRKDAYSALNIDKKFKIDISINKHPTKRTNASNVEEEHALYVICENASVATAFLHHIGDRIANKEPIDNSGTTGSNDILQDQLRVREPGEE